MLMCGATLKLIDYGSSRFIMTRGGEVGEVVGTAEFMGKRRLMLYLVHTVLPCCFHTFPSNWNFVYPIIPWTQDVN